VGVGGMGKTRRVRRVWRGCGERKEGEESVLWMGETLRAFRLAARGTHIFWPSARSSS
jgi:hypothetical protein